MGLASDGSGVGIGTDTGIGTGGVTGFGRKTSTWRESPDGPRIDT